MVRVKQTGEVCEVSRETMKILPTKKRNSDSMSGVPVIGCEEEKTTLLSLDYVSYEGGEVSPASGWLILWISRTMLFFTFGSRSFKAVLTPFRVKRFWKMLYCQGLTMRGYEERVSCGQVKGIKGSIQEEKYKNFLICVRQNAKKCPLCCSVKRANKPPFAVP